MALGEMNSGNGSTDTISWTANIKCATWCRLCKVKSQYNIIGTSFIFNYAATRTNVVYNETLIINTNHSKRASVSKLGASHYAQTKIRIISDLVVIVLLKYRTRTMEPHHQHSNR